METRFHPLFAKRKALRPASPRLPLISRGQHGESQFEKKREKKHCLEITTAERAYKVLK